MTNEPLMTVEPAMARRMIALVVLAALGLLLVYLGFTVAGDFLGRIFLVIMGGLCIWATSKMYAATSQSLILTTEGLQDSAGEILATMDDIDRVDRGMFAFKPSNGFIVLLKTRSTRAWRPGLWWRFGKRIGIGGVTNAGQNKAMAEILTAELNKRDTDPNRLKTSTEFIQDALKKPDE